MRRFTFDWQIVPFALSALSGLALAYNQPVAVIRCALIAIGVMLYLFCANARDAQTRSILRALLIVLPALITIYFVLTNDWAKSSNKLPLLSALPALIGGLPQFNPNVVGGSLAMLLPLQWKALEHQQRAIKFGVIAITLIGLALSLTRGAWLALALVSGLWFAWRWLNQRMANQRQARWIWLAGVLALAVIGGVVIFATPLGDRLLGLGGDRTHIWRNSLALVGDYPLSGFGLGSFEMAYSSYALLTHVGHTVHAHNLWLNVWLEQGLLGLVALIGLVFNAWWPRSGSSGWRMAALASLGVVLIHTLVDDPFYGYGGPLMSVLFVPLGLLHRRGNSTGVEALAGSRIKPSPTFAVWAIAALGVAILFVLPSGRAVIEANLGAIDQTRAELSVYHWPEVGLQDVLRETGGVELGSAIGHYQAALALDAASASANRRLGQIELARRQIDVACDHLQRANATADQRATRQLLGECYALRGEVEQAVAVWSTIDLSQGQLYARDWWYGTHLASPDQAQALTQAAEALRAQ
ncbi:MAG: O-antigen ligase family protein [Chloroflexi bacterium]|nr:O-antigen ligase family protein [Chloroflexota bacterium]